MPNRSHIQSHPGMRERVRFHQDDIRAVSIKTEWLVLIENRPKSYSEVLKELLRLNLALAPCSSNKR